ncbi:YitT family protein [Candidatus Phytoplasma melaleucae]|uniref:YitT family protein n=1 Tax=Candidatus Phytoplasma melaleucae TaxID=2982630 RepID=A0ABT9DD56_9MOLU|nr:YitT family protein ['Melaleuca sp.' phytoplasma]MDO8168005.1 YitT family protein ['Melaleuca sp.' phytoplasma]
MKNNRDNSLFGPKNKLHVKTIFINIFLCFIYSLSDVFFNSGNYKVNSYATGIHGIGDAIAKILKANFIFLKNNSLFVGLFSAFFYIIINAFLFIFISFPKLSYKFTISTLINSISIFVFLILLTASINNNNSLYLNKMKNFFGLFDMDGGFWSSFVRIIVSAILGGIIGGITIRIGGSTGGIDIISKYLNVYKQKDISLMICLFNYSISVIATLLIYFTTKKFYWESIFLTNFIKIPLSTFFMYFTTNRNKQNHLTLKKN